MQNTYWRLFGWENGSICSPICRRCGKINHWYGWYSSTLRKYYCNWFEKIQATRINWPINFPHGGRIKHDWLVWEGRDIAQELFDNLGYSIPAANTSHVGRTRKSYILLIFIVCYNYYNYAFVISVHTVLILR